MNTPPKEVKEDLLPKTLRGKVHDYWMMSSYWNGRIQIGGTNPSFSVVIRALQQRLACSLQYHRLARVYTLLIQEIIMHGQKKYPSELKDNVVQLRGKIYADDAFDRIVGGPYNEIPLQEQA